MHSEVLVEHAGKIFEAASIDRADGFAPPFSGRPYPCLIWNHDARFGDADRRAVATALLEAGCRYVVCGGEECEAWHDAVDHVFLAEHADGDDEAWEASFVMTTWHEDEDPDEVAFFFVQNTDFAEHDFDRYLVLHVGSGPARAQVDAAVRKYALGEDAV